MQNELRNLLEQRFNHQGGDYYYDMSGQAGGELIAGARRRKRAHLVKGSAAAKRHMAEVRAAKGGARRRRRYPIRRRRRVRRGGELIDLDNYYGGADDDDDEPIVNVNPIEIKEYPKSHYDEIGGKYRNPIDRAMEQARRKRKDDLFKVTKAAEYANKLHRKAEMIENAISNYKDEAEEFENDYKTALSGLSKLAPYKKAGKKAGYSSADIIRLASLIKK